jgi:hypothetical protein
MNSLNETINQSINQSSLGQEKVVSTDFLVQCWFCHYAFRVFEFFLKLYTVHILQNAYRAAIVRSLWVLYRDRDSIVNEIFENRKTSENSLCRLRVERAESIGR